MAHMIDSTTGKNAIAYMNETPWHGLGQKMAVGMSVEEWQREAGLDFKVKSAEVRYMNGIERVFKGRNVLYRSDTGAPLSVVSDSYNPVQPSEVMDFFREIADASNFQLETAGALSGGKRIWALAKVGDGEAVVTHDVVKPYLLLATSYDGTMATTAKFTTVRVVCHNTLSMSESDVDHMTKVLHRERFDAAKVRRELGIATNSFERFMLRAQRLSKIELSPKQVDSLTFDLIASITKTPLGGAMPDIRKTKGYGRVMDLFNGEAKGATMAGQTAWGWLNAVTQMVDWERGRTPDSRINSAWFGAGAALKSKAAEMADLIADFEGA